MILNAGFGRFADEIAHTKPDDKESSRATTRGYHMKMAGIVVVVLVLCVLGVGSYVYYSKLQWARRPEQSP